MQPLHVRRNREWGMKWGVILVYLPELPNWQMTHDLSTTIHAIFKPQPLPCMGYRSFGQDVWMPKCQCYFVSLVNVEVAMVTKLMRDINLSRDICITWHLEAFHLFWFADNYKNKTASGADAPSFSPASMATVGNLSLSLTNLVVGPKIFYCCFYSRGICATLLWPPRERRRSEISIGERTSISIC